MADDPQLPPDARELINEGANDVYISSASVLEMAIKSSIGKLELPGDLFEQLARAGFGELPVDHEDGWEAGRLPWHHRDPFDRILIAQARNKALTIMTSDGRFPAYQVSIYKI